MVAAGEAEGVADAGASAGGPAVVGEVAAGTGARGPADAGGAAAVLPPWRRCEHGPPLATRSPASSATRRKEPLKGARMEDLRSPEADTGGAAAAVPPWRCRDLARVGESCA